MSLEITNLKKTYSQGGQKLEILKGVNSQIKSGEIVAILGQSGSGKSTLLAMLAGLDKPDSGSIVISNSDITQFNQNQMTEFRGKKIGIVFQQFHLVAHLTALENVMLPLQINKEKNCEEKAKAILQQVGLSERINHLPSQLSGGECQRVSIARAIVTTPEILLADEPSGNLDVNTGNLVMKILFDVVKDKKITTLVVTHNEDIAKQCDRELRLNNGLL